MDNSEKFASNATAAIIKTLSYSDIFDYPLLADEVWKYLISENNIDKKVFDNKIKTINSVVFRKDGFYHMDGKSFITSKRIKRYKESQRKIKLADKIIKKLFIVPTVLFIGISGNLSMMNAQRKDDVDLFVITRKNTAWLTRFFLILYLKILGKHRKRGDEEVSDKICLNMIIDEENLSLPKNLRNLYTAHETVQLVPIRQRGNIYNKFISANKWVKKFLPNAFDDVKNKNIQKEGKTFLGSLIIGICSFYFFEKIARLFQKKLMEKNLTREVIDANFIALHPKDHKKIILSKYYEKLSRYDLQI